MLLARRALIVFLFCFHLDCLQLGFLPRKTAKWVSPLWDVGFFQFSAYICPKDALAAALGESNKQVPLLLHVSQAWYFEFVYFDSRFISLQHNINRYV